MCLSSQLAVKLQVKLSNIELLQNFTLPVFIYNIGYIGYGHVFKLFMSTHSAVFGRFCITLFSRYIQLVYCINVFCTGRFNGKRGHPLSARRAKFVYCTTPSHCDLSVMYVLYIRALRRI